MVPAWYRCGRLFVTQGTYVVLEYLRLGPLSLAIDKVLLLASFTSSEMPSLLLILRIRNSQHRFFWPLFSLHATEPYVLRTCTSANSKAIESIHQVNSGQLLSTPANPIPAVHPQYSFSTEKLSKRRHFRQLPAFFSLATPFQSIPLPFCHPPPCQLLTDLPEHATELVTTPLAAYSNTNTVDCHTRCSGS